MIIVYYVGCLTKNPNLSQLRVFSYRRRHGPMVGVCMRGLPQVQIPFYLFLTVLDSTLPRFVKIPFRNLLIWPTYGPSMEMIIIYGITYGHCMDNTVQQFGMATAFHIKPILCTVFIQLKLYCLILWDCYSTYLAEIHR